LGGELHAREKKRTSRCRTGEKKGYSPIAAGKEAASKEALSEKDNNRKGGRLFLSAKKNDLGWSGLRSYQKGPFVEGGREGEFVQKDRASMIRHEEGE